MFTCLWQLWDWLDPTLLFTPSTMENKQKAQQMQSLNTKNSGLYSSPSEYQAAQSMVFQHYPQYQNLSSNYAQINLTNQKPELTQSQHIRRNNNMDYGNENIYGEKHTPNSNNYNIQQNYPQHEPPPPPAQQGNHQHYSPGDEYQGKPYYQVNNTKDRIYYQQSVPRLTTASHTHSSSQLQQQYQQLQQAKLQQQIKVQNEALIQQQRTFALRQQLNPPVPQSHYHLQHSMTQDSIPKLSIAQQPQRIPPSSLHLTNQFQPAGGPVGNINEHYMLKTAPNQRQQHDDSAMMNKHLIQNQAFHNQALYQKSQQLQQNLMQHKYHQQSQQQDSPSQIIIHQNHPNLVVNQACQTQISDSSDKKNSSENITSPQTPSHAVLEKKRSGNQLHTLKSPVTKRPVAGTVTISGWLHKQGSDGLKVWRKRWFVLSDYILYYYKNSEEEKLLGSILLPSYKVSICLPEDKIYKKFAFKCEHLNMRTYWLAAESHESMEQWIKALTAATMMQRSCESDQTSQPSISSLNQSCENSDSGIQTYQSQQSKMSLPGPLTPASDNGGAQPLYANAPPKPKRVNDGGYSSPSSDVERCDLNYDSLRHHERLRNENLRSLSLQRNEINKELYQINQENNLKRLQNFKDEINEKIYDFQQTQQDQEFAQRYSNHNHHHHPQSQQQKPQQQQPQSQHPQHAHQQQKSQENENLLAMYTNPERRTPDTYGRSRLRQQQQQLQQQQLQQQQQQAQQQQFLQSQLPQGNYFSDYEDIYNAKQQAPNRNDGENNSVWTYKRPMSPTGYDSEINHMPNFPYSGYVPSQYLESNMTQHIQMRARPVKATPTPRPHSADFLEYEARNPDRSYNQSEIAHVQRPKSSLDINRTSDNFYYSEAKYAEKMRESAMYLQKLPQITPDKGNADYYHSMQKSLPGTSPASTSNFNTVPSIHNNKSELILKKEAAHLAKEKSISIQNERFLRSASARFSRKDDNSNEMDGEKKREESMKRLLDWKQRMLQSPLTRKGVASKLTSPSVASTPVSTTQKLRTKPPKETPSAERNDNSGYNSYSSDDEASISVRNVRNAMNPNNLTNETETSNLIKSYNHHTNQINSPTPSSYYDSTQRSNNDPSKSGYYNILSTYNENVRMNQNLMRNDNHRKETEADKNILKSLDVSAGDLLSRTHEELVLLLIQLRRQNSNTARAIEQTCTEIHNIQNCIRNSEGTARIEQITKLENAKQHLFQLEQQYEKSKPLVNLVDNMVKLGSLYRGGPRSISQQPQSPESIERLEFNHRIQERRLLQEEKTHWDRLSPNHLELKSKVQQLFQLDQLLQEESGTLQSLQRDKEDIERALGGLRARLKYGEDTPIALEAAKRHQYALERELSRVHHLLAENSKKLEQTVAGNARLEQELLILRQKLQASRLSKSSSYGSQTEFNTESQNSCPSSMTYNGTSTSVLELELRRVQKLVGDMQRQRQELSQAVRQLTDNSNVLYQQIKPDPYSATNNGKKSQSTGWQETNIDSLQSVKHSLSDTSSLNKNSIPNNKYQDAIPSLYVDTESSNNLNVYNDYISSRSPINENDKYQNYKHQQNEVEGLDSSEIESDYFLDDNSGNADKQEIKTVRIVKRESQQRQRDREKASISFAAQNLDQSYDERELDYNNTNDTMNNYNNSKVYSDNYVTRDAYRPKNNRDINESIAIAENSLKYSDYYNNLVNQYPISMTDNDNKIYKQVVTSPKENNSQEKSIYNEHHMGLKNKTESIQSLTKVVPDISPLFQSEAAKQIMIEMGNSNDGSGKETISPANKQRRAVPKEKRRHNTAPHYLNAKWMQSMQAENDLNSNATNWRARDDLDMEVALRPRINTPDVVRSAVGPRENISETTIDKLLAAPSKILIPERYIPEQIPELSPEEKKKRQEKVEAIKKMLSEAPINSSNDASTLPSNKISAEKKQREHLLQLNQLLAQQVMQMSKIVAEKAIAALPSKVAEINSMTEDDHSPVEPLPIYQERENYFS